MSFFADLKRRDVYKVAIGDALIARWNAFRL
jgi:hypothetical protein